jgi:hypothetical protein
MGCFDCISNFQLLCGDKFLWTRFFKYFPKFQLCCGSQLYCHWWRKPEYVPDYQHALFFSQNVTIKMWSTLCSDAGLFVCLMVFNATFNNISVTYKLDHIMLYTPPWSCKSNYHDDPSVTQVQTQHKFYY